MATAANSRQSEIKRERRAQSLRCEAPGAVGKQQRGRQDRSRKPRKGGKGEGGEVEWQLNGPINLRAVVRRLTFSVSKMNFPWGVEQGSDVI